MAHQHKTGHSVPFNLDEVTVVFAGVPSLCTAVDYYCGHGCGTAAVFARHAAHVWRDYCRV